MDKVKYGIMGGSFDPVHCGHVMVANEVAHACGMERVIFIPAGNPPHKDSKIMADFKHRYNMVKLAIKGNDLFEISDIESKCTGKSYTVDTIRIMRENLNTDEICFITGTDAVLQLRTWKEPENLMKLCRFIAVDRPGYTDVADELHRLAEAYGGTIDIVHVPVMGISSTDIRRRVSSDMTIKYMVPDAVESYIKANRLYQ